jgi:hypothetical protein
MENNILLIAIPKSASTSLMYTIANNFNLNCGQYFPNKNEITDYDTVLSKYHSDIGDFTPELVAKITKDNYVSKQHIFPSYTNIELFKNKKKIVLLRDPYDICLAYQRGVESGYHRVRFNFKIGMSSNDWMIECEKSGLIEDLKKFSEKWMNKIDNNTLLINFENFKNFPEKTLKEIASFYNLTLPKNKAFVTVNARKTGIKKMNWKQHYRLILNKIKSL